MPIFTQRKRTMTNKLFSLVAGAALLALAGTANAGQPLQLSDNQMERVTAGGTGIADAAALALGEVLADTTTQTATNVQTATFPHIAVGEAYSQALAAGGFLFQAAAAVHSDSAASLP
jgi:hypothetical protein